MKYGLLIFLFALHATAQARVFNYKDSSLAAYVRGTAGSSSAGKEAFGGSSGTDTLIDAKSDFSYSGDFGVNIGLSQKLNLRLGLELIGHRPVNEAKGYNTAKGERFRLDSSIFIFNPHATLEYVYKESGNTRFYAGFGAGMSDITVENRYTMTPLGSSELSNGDFAEKMSAKTGSFHIVTGIETLFVDNTTVSFDLGYRYMPLKELKYKAAVDNLVGTGAAEGDVARNHNGEARSMDLGGVYLGFTFKFYLNFL